MSYVYGIYLLKEAISAYESLKKVYDKFAISEDMMGLDRGNHFKMWVN